MGTVDNSSLVGGAIERRLEHSKVPPVDHAFVLAPFRRPGDDAELASLIEGRPLHVEIGFGRPHHLCDLAASHPEATVLGFEIKRRWCRDAARRSVSEGLTNLRVIEGDARAYIERFFEADSVDAYHVLFPDPWWKRRHHKRRVFRADFLEVMHRTLAPGGYLIARTDVPAYADFIDELLLAHPGFELELTPPFDDPIFEALPRSHREKKCLGLGIPVTRFRFNKLTA